ncbi:MAG: hypothetical protein HYX60_08905 [Legionella longbeachae]|nr:hypothetical protein [Legionella longbeachae]
MVQVQFVSGNYKEICQKGIPGLTPSWLFYTDNSSHEILKDIHRQLFLHTNGKTFDDFIAAWISPHASKSYTQGNITATLFSKMPHFMYYVEPFKEKLDNKYKNNGTDIWTKCGENKTDISFAFFDDDGVPCGFSLYLTNDDEGKPNTWVVSVIRNTTAEPEYREAIIFGPQDILRAPNDPLVSLTDAEKKLSSFINSKELANHLKDIFLANGEVDISKLSKFEPNKPSEKDNVGLFIGHTTKTEALITQEPLLQDWKLTTEEFNLVKNKVKEKQSEAITKAFDCYDFEVKKDHKKDIKNIENELKQFEKQFIELKKYKENLNNSTDYQSKLKKYTEKKKKLEEHTQKLSELKKYKENLKTSEQYPLKLEDYKNKFNQFKDYKENLKDSNEYKSELEKYESTLLIYKERLASNKFKLDNIQLDPNKISQSVRESNKQTFLRRNAVPSFFGSIGVLGVISLTLIASGVFAPFGLVLSGLTFIAALAGIAISGLVTLTSAAVVWRKESQLREYS